MKDNVSGSSPKSSCMKGHFKLVKMLVIFRLQDVIEVVTVGFAKPGKNATEDKRPIFKQQQKLDNKA
ncbi:hypothetical protein CR513_09698, partial [Mucuna pruriens]